MQTFNLPAKPYFIYNSDNGSYLRVGVDPFLYAYEQITDGTYQETFIIDAGNEVNGFWYGDDLLILPLRNGKINIYRGESYELVQTTLSDWIRVRKVVYSQKLGMFVAGRASGLVQIFRHNGAQFEQVQEFSAGFSIFALLLDLERLIIAGISSEVLFYRFNGTVFYEEQRIPTDEFYIYDIYPSSDMA